MQQWYKWSAYLLILYFSSISPHYYLKQSHLGVLSVPNLELSPPIGCQITLMCRTTVHWGFKRLVTKTHLKGHWCTSVSSNTIKESLLFFLLSSNTILHMTCINVDCSNNQYTKKEFFLFFSFLPEIGLCKHDL